MHNILKPNKILTLIDKYIFYLGLLNVILWALGLYFSFFGSPSDYIQGEAVRIMYVHVPASWMALMVYGMMAFMGCISLVWRTPLSELIGIAAAPIGLTFTLISLITGSLWGKPMWGAWWVWDARLTSMLILFFLYLGYIALISAFRNKERGLKIAAVLAVMGALDLPIIKWSVTWWHTLHQPPSIMKFSAPSIHPTILWPLGVMMSAFFCYFLLVLALRLRTEIKKRKQWIKGQIE